MRRLRPRRSAGRPGKMPNEIQTLRTGEDLERVLERSRETAVWLFKHSPICGVSRAAWEEFRQFAETSAAGGGGAEFVMIEIQSARPLSDAVAERTGVRHESPQVLLLREGGVEWHASHWRITRRALERQHG